MKKLLLSSALAASVLFTGASFAEVKIGATLETTINTLQKKTASTQDNSGPTTIGQEAVITVSTSKALSNGLNLSAGFAIDVGDDADQFLTLSSGGTAFSIGNDVTGVMDNVSQEDFTPNVAQDFHEVNIGTIGSAFTSHSRNGIFLKHTTDMITFESAYIPSAATLSTAGSDNTAASGSGYEVAVKGNLGVPGLTAGYGFSESNVDSATASTATNQSGKAYGVKYAIAGFTVGYGFVDNDNTSYKTATKGVSTEIASYGVSYQVNKGLSISAAIAEVDVSNVANDEEYKTLQVGYDFGGMGITAGYYQVDNVGGVSGTDQEVFEIRTVTKF